MAAVAHELLAGAPPFGRGDILRIFRVQSQTGPAPLPAGVAEDLRAITADLATIDVEARRFRSAAEMLRVLEQAGAPMSTHAELGALVQRACEAAPGRGDDALAHTLLSPARRPQGPQGAGGPRPGAAPAPLALAPPRRLRGWMRPGMLMPAALLALAVFLAGVLAGRGRARRAGAPVPAHRGAHAGEAAVCVPSPAAASPHATPTEETRQLSGVGAAVLLPPPGQVRTAAESSAILAPERAIRRAAAPDRRAHPSPSQRRKPKNVAPHAAELP